MPPMVRNYADKRGLVTPRYVAHIKRIAEGGIGTIILEASFINPSGKGFIYELGIHSDECIPGLKKLVAVAHKNNVKIGPQLYHAGRQTSGKTTGMQPLAPSPVPDPSSGEMPHELTVSEIKRLIAEYGLAAGRAKAAGCDFVEIHGAHGYLITQFLSPFSNIRTDSYGGSFENRFRFLAEVVASVRNAVGKNFPATVRLSGDELVPGGLTIKETVRIATELEGLGVNGLHISAGNYASYNQGLMIPPMAVPEGPLVHLAEAVKKAVSIPVIAVGKIRTPEFAEKILTSNKADFVAIGRTLLADPDWPNKVASGKTTDIMPCIACNQGCIGRLFAQEDVWCTVNPETGRENAFAQHSKKKKTVVIIGGGPAGLSAARVAAKRGHTVTLYEKSNKLSGQLTAAGAAPHREGWTVYKKIILRDLKQPGITVHLKSEYSPEQARRERPDAIIIAIGSSAVRPKIPGIGRTNVVIARDLLEGKVKAKGTVVVAGGGCAGAQTAEYLATHGHAVTIVEAMDAIALDAPSDERELLLGRLKKMKVKLLTNCKLTTIGSRTVTTEDKDGSKTLPADTVVLCLGSFPNDGLAAELKQIIKNTVVVGDASSPRRVTEAVAEGALAALAL